MKQKLHRILNVSALCAAALSTCACAPKIYVIEHHTILEEEAAGSWPKLEDQFRKDVKKKGATFFGHDEGKDGRKSALNIINGELTDKE